MENKLLLCITVFLVFNLNAQEKNKTDSFGVNDEVEIENAPNFYAKRFSEYKLNDNWNLRVEMIQQSVEGKTLFELPFLFKHNINNKLNIIIGPEINLLKEKDGNIEHTTFEGVFGLQYDATKNIQLDARFNYRINNNELPIQNHYSTGSRNTLNLGSRFKF
ncbi:hypothetical protein [uncultured Lacinutrix sp.]|uniref:hypothetical protein n=1 Tax=uncultured Lacinutrix sp. TaxID=574032 RepID=UPI002625A8BD|nr:hypothetical protein [uncultured Lacinutrix sp.]